ncbi:MAG: tetratricopeptide repeat protein [Gammaproteobacteria bacterium]
MPAVAVIDGALAAEFECPIDPEPLPHLSWAETELTSADELYTRAREGFRHWSYDTEFRLAIFDSLSELKQRDPEDVRAYVELARFAMIEGFVGRLALSEEAYDFAEQMLDRALELDDQYAPAWALEGLFRLHRRGPDDLYGDTDAVETALAESERLDPDSSEVAFAWASYYSLRFRYDLAIAEMQRLLEHEANSDEVAAAAYRRLGAYYRDDGDRQRALAAAERAIALDRYDPRNLLLYSSLALEERGGSGRRGSTPRALSGPVGDGEPEARLCPLCFVGNR